MAYTDIDKPSDYFNTALYTGNYSTNNITSLDFQPDLVWIKKRSAAESHVLTDVVRGTGGNLYSNSTSAEDTGVTTGVTSFNSDGFSLGANNGFNQSGATFVSWNWKAGTSFTNDASATGIGTIDSTGSVNTDAGFSIVGWTGSGANATVGHGLGAVPKMIIIRRRTGSTTNWIVYHESIGNNNELFLNLTNASTSSTRFQSTSPTSSVFSVSSNSAVNESSQSIIAYCFAEKQGYSKFGSYTGNGNADGTFIYTGFSPAWFMIKRTDSASSWRIWDNKRDTFNVRDTSLNANQSNAEYTDASVYIDFLANGVKFRNADDNVSGGSYIFMCFASNPFTTSTGVPACAR